MQFLQIVTVSNQTEIGLVIILAVLRKDRTLFRQAIAELSASQSQDASLKLIKQAKYLLTDQQKEWIDGHLWKLWADPHGKNKYLPYTAYKVRQAGAVKLSHVVPIRFSDAEHQRIAEFASGAGKSRSEWLREVLREKLEVGA